MSAPSNPRSRVVATAALGWSLQFALFNPALALTLAGRFDATGAQIGLALAIYNGSGFVSALLIPMVADRRANYLTPIMWGGLASIPLMAILGLADHFATAAAALLVLGGPASIGVPLLFAHMRAAGHGQRSIINTRAIVSSAWVAGPPLAALIAGALGDEAVLLVIAIIAVLGLAMTDALRRRDAVGGADTLADADSPTLSVTAVPLAATTGVVVGFVALQATNSVVVSLMALYVTETLGLPVIWSGVALAVAAALEIPALILAGKITKRYSSLTLIMAGCAIGVAYYVSMWFVRGPIELLSAQILNAAFFAAVSGVGLTYFQEIISAPGFASGLFTNVQRLGAISAGGVVALAPIVGGYRDVFLVCAGLTLFAFFVLAAVGFHIRFARQRAAA